LYTQVGITMRPPSGWPLFWETATCVNEVNVSQGQVNCDRWSHLVHECIGKKTLACAIVTRVCLPPPVEAVWRTPTLTSLLSGLGPAVHDLHDALCKGTLSTLALKQTTGIAIHCRLEHADVNEDRGETKENTKLPG